MKIASSALFLSLAVAPGFAQKPCEDLKSEIAAKLDAKGVKNYQLTIVTPDAVKDQTVVGSCELGTKRITYKKDAAPAAKPATMSTAHPGPTPK